MHFENIEKYNSYFISDSTLYLHYLVFKNKQCILIKTDSKTFDTNLDIDCILSGIYRENVFLINDVLYKNNVMINPNEITFDCRLLIIDQLYKKIKTQNLINLNIQIQPNVINSEYTSKYILENIFLNNFKYKHFYNDENKTIEMIKRIVKKENYSELYSVHDVETNNYQGLLHLKSLNDSVKFEQLYKQSTDKLFKCNFNLFFNKWSCQV